MIEHLKFIKKKAEIALEMIKIVLSVVEAAAAALENTRAYTATAAAAASCCLYK